MTKAYPTRQVQVLQYLTPLREGGSLPAVVYADDDFKYVLKFKGAGHGVKALIAEYIGGEIGRSLGFQVPEQVFATLDEAFGRTEPDEEIQDLLAASRGTNLGLHFLSGATNFDPNVASVGAEVAGRVVWLDAFLTNIDRTFRNTNMLIWHQELWLIDHGASLYFHHRWEDWKKAAQNPFLYVKDHVLLPQTNSEAIAEAKAIAMQTLTQELFEGIVNQLPEEWLQWPDTAQSPEEIRHIYIEFLLLRLKYANLFTKEAQHAAARL